jgi:hypothetical protein
MCSAASGAYKNWTRDACPPLFMILSPSTSTGRHLTLTELVETKHSYRRQESYVQSLWDRAPVLYLIRSAFIGVRAYQKKMLVKQW